MVTPQHAEVVVKATLVLHNQPRKEMGVQYINTRTADHDNVGGVLHLREWRSEGSKQLRPMVRKVDETLKKPLHYEVYLRNTS